MLRKTDKSAQSIKCVKICKLNDLKNRNQQTSNNKEDNNKQNFNVEIQSDSIQFPPPVSCIRVLRPSNDLTPVRFDSHYNIIQALNAIDLLAINPLTTADQCLEPALTSHSDETDGNNFDYEFQTCSY